MPPMAEATSPAPTPASPPAPTALPRTRRADRSFTLLLAYWAGAYALSAVVFFGFGLASTGLGPISTIARPWLGALALAFLLAVPLSGVVRPPSRTSHLRKLNPEAILAMAWVIVATGGSEVLGFFAQSAPAWHFAHSALLAATPLALLAWMVHHRGMAGRRSLVRPPRPTPSVVLAEASAGTGTHEDGS